MADSIKVVYDGRINTSIPCHRQMNTYTDLTQLTIVTNQDALLYAIVDVFNPIQSVLIRTIDSNQVLFEATYTTAVLENRGLFPLRYIVPRNCIIEIQGFASQPFDATVTRFIRITR